MEKRFVLFLGLSLGILVGYSMLMRVILPPPAVPPQDPTEIAQADVDKTPAEPIDAVIPPEKTAEVQVPDAAAPDATDPAIPTRVSIPQRWTSVGSYAAGSGHSLLVTFNSRGAAIEHAELTSRDAKGRLRYRDLEDKSGYLGHLALTPHPSAGCVINVVGDGTPAALAGLQVGDILLTLNEQPINYATDFDVALAPTKPGDTVTLTVRQTSVDPPPTISVTATLDERPLELIRPEPLQGSESIEHPLSYLLTVTEKAEPSPITIDQPRHQNWELVLNEEGVVEFRLNVESPTAADSRLELVKRYRLGKIADLEAATVAASYHVDLELEIRNRSATPRRLGYRLSGPSGLPLEGWWYSAKIHPKMFYSAGARDVWFSTASERQRLIGCPELYKLANKQPQDRSVVLFAEDEAVTSRTLHFLAVDTQYFAAVLVPQSATGTAEGVFRRAEAFALGDVSQQPKGLSRTTDVSFSLDSEWRTVEPDDAYRERFRLFLGPKDPDILAAYDLDDVLYHGWFGGIAKLLKQILHFFYRVVGNYGIAIILLTVVVRGCMFPISRKAAKNAAMMQELAPEMRKLTEKYKTDMEKRAKAQQELFRKHNYNPFGGCWLMFLQLPIFLGLYRCIAVDIDLRQAALIPGLEWSSNLAGPDMLFNWENFLPSMFVSESGMLGPYFNVLPLVTVAFFLVHQKLFTPPATDDQSRMQLQMMKYMTLFMGFMFFKVASGLCLYFIASSVWGIAERKLIPKPKINLTGVTNDAEAPPTKRKLPELGNGAEEKKAERKRRPKRR